MNSYTIKPTFIHKLPSNLPFLKIEGKVSSPKQKENCSVPITKLK